MSNQQWPVLHRGSRPTQPVYESCEANGQLTTVLPGAWDFQTMHETTPGYVPRYLGTQLLNDATGIAFVSSNMAFMAYPPLHDPQGRDNNQYTEAFLDAMNNALRVQLWNSNFSPERLIIITPEKNYNDFFPTQPQININKI